MGFLQTMNMQMVHFPRRHKTCAQHFSASVKSEHPTHIRQELGKKSHSYVQGLNSDLEKNIYCSVACPTTSLLLVLWQNLRPETVPVFRDKNI